MLEDSGFTDIVTGPPADTFGGASGEEKARAFEVYGYAFLSRKPTCPTAPTSDSPATTRRH